MTKDIKVTSGHQLKEEVERINAEKAASQAPATTTAIVEAKSAGALAEKFFAPQEIEDMAGAGSENVKTTDTLLPRLTILQSLSPQLNRKKAEFISGAKVGDFCDVAVGDIFEEVDMIPCHFVTQYIHWKKSRGGFVANLGTSAACLEETTLNEKRENVLPNGDTIVETATWFCLLRAGSDWRRVFFPLSKTGLKVSRKWHTLIKAEKLMGKNGYFTPPLFYRPWRLTVVTDSKDEFDWFTPSPARIEVPPEMITAQSPERFKTIYHEMMEIQDTSKWLLTEAKKFYTDARDNLVVGDMSNSDDLNDPSNARVVGSGPAIDNTSTQM